MTAFGAKRTLLQIADYATICTTLGALVPRYIAIVTSWSALMLSGSCTTQPVAIQSPLNLPDGIYFYSLLCSIDGGELLGASITLEHSATGDRLYYERHRGLTFKRVLVTDLLINQKTSGISFSVPAGTSTDDKLIHDKASKDDAENIYLVTRADELSGEINAERILITHDRDGDHAHREFKRFPDPNQVPERCPQI